MLAATNGLREVSAGIPNHSSRLTTTAPITSPRARGTRIHSQIAYRPSNGHASGRPSPASDGEHERRAGAARQVQVDGAQARSATIIGSDWALR